MQDIRDIVFRNISKNIYRAVLISERDGILSGVNEAVSIAEELGIEWKSDYKDGDKLYTNKIFAELTGTPKQIAMAEERIIGTLSKTSGIATAAKRAVMLADGKARIVSGSWKKMPPCMKDMVRLAITSGGAAFRICEPPMLYMDKNFVAMCGSVKSALDAASGISETTKVIQIRGLNASIEQETAQALEGGAGILMVDTGKLEDVASCMKELERLDSRDKVSIAFAGNVRLEDIPSLAERGIDILCIGKEIVDAPLLDMKLNVVGEVKK